MCRHHMSQHKQTIPLHSYINITLWKVADWWDSISVLFLLGWLHGAAQFAYNTHPTNSKDLLSNLKLTVLHILQFCDSIRASDVIRCKVIICANFGNIERAADSVWSLC